MAWSSDPPQGLSCTTVLKGQWPVNKYSRLSANVLDRSSRVGRPRDGLVIPLLPGAWRYDRPTMEESKEKLKSKSCFEVG